MAFVLWVFCSLLIGGSARAQDEAKPDTVVIFDPSTADSLRRLDLAGGDTLMMYGLNEIVVSSGEDRSARTSTVQKVSLAQIARQDAAAVSGLARLLPAAHVQTNSRGETLVYLRNSGERQVAFFFDGALLNVPWDYRVDLSMIPSSVVGAMTVAKGVPSVVFGTNVLGGAVNITSRDVEKPGSHGELSVHGGHPVAGHVTGTYMHRKDRLHVAASAGCAYDRGDALAKDAALEYSQLDQDIRTNSDQRLSNLFGRIQYDLSDDASVSVTALHIDTEKGVPPEGHLDPSVDRVRFWRYPLWRHSMLIVSGSLPAGGGRLRGAAWGTRVRQDIARYESASFGRLAERQENGDWTGGSRVIWSLPAAGGVIQLAANALTSRHVQRDIPMLDGGDSEAADAGFRPSLHFQQHLFSFGTEYDRAVSPHLDILVGSSIDVAAMPLTGDKPSRDPFFDYGLTTGLVYRPDPSVAFRAAAGRKVRFPTMRELFGEAINRFVVNPDLNPETSYVMEVGSSVDVGGGHGELVLFANRTIGPIDQETLPDGRRRRINLEESRTVGIEGSGSFRAPGGWRFNGHATWLHTRGHEDGDVRPVPERPNWLATGSLTYDLRPGLSLVGEVVYTGTAYSMDETGAFVPLPSSVTLNARLSYRGFVLDRPGVFAEFFVRANNVTDQVVVPQLGLPAPGREITAGVNLSF